MDLLIAAAVVFLISFVLIGFSVVAALFQTLKWVRVGDDAINRTVKTGIVLFFIAALMAFWYIINL
jgi:hypothetical protein